MRRLAPFVAFTAVFAAAAAFVFWGTWATATVPVMPDCATRFPAAYAADWIVGWKASGKFVPGDLAAFLGSPYLWVELQYAIAAYCAALGLAYFLRGRGLGRAASYGAGLLLAFSGYWFSLFSAGHLGWFRWMTYGVFAFGLIDRALERGLIRHWLLLGAVVAWASFYQPDLWLLFTIFTAAYFVFRSVAVRPGWRRWLSGSAIALAAFAVIGFPSIRSAYVVDLAGREKQIESGETVADQTLDDAEKRWIFTTNWSMPPEDTLEFFVPRIHGDTSCPMTLAIGNKRGTGVKPYTGRLGRPKDAPAGNYRQHSLYVGWVTCLLAIFGVAATFATRRGVAANNDAASASARDARRTVLFFSVAAVLFWILSMGRFTPAYRLVYMIPIGDSIRAPVKWHHLTEFCIAVLAGFGIERLWRIASPCGVAAKCAVAALVLFGVADLARVNALYCAPHTADADLAPIPQPIPKDPAQAKQFHQTVRKYGLKPVGHAEMSGYDILWVEQPAKPIQPRTEADNPPLTGFPRIAAFASVFATFAVLAYSALPLLRRRRPTVGEKA